ncbi:MAG: hypothetical protein IJK77_07920 [Lachnospiraceae bacterium]|nr:hypothetical protein [Lachnospiraceae bacterium]
MRRNKKIMSLARAAALFIAVIMCLGACGKQKESSGAETTSAESTPAEAETEPVATSSEMDKTGKYPLDTKTGEAVITGPEFTSAGPTDDNARVFYEIFVGSFSDSNGDGIGDLRGIINRMDYLNDGDPDSGESLGVEGIWLTPIFRSPTYHKYDATNYYEVDSSFGTMDDLKELIDLCHERNVKLILDLVLNHTSTNNKWFVEFKNAHVNGDTSSPYYDFYSWGTQSYLSGRAFNRINDSDHYYECNFFSGMPELNYDNEAVREEMVEVAKYYLDLGVDGFRFDAAKYIYFGDNKASEEFWAWYITELKKVKPDIYTVGEVWDSDSITQLYYPAFNCFNFTGAQTSGLYADAARMGNVNGLTNYTENYLKTVQAMRADAMFVPFIANHDTDRSAGYLTVASGYAYVGANLLILGPGSPFIYYGEEIGMKGSRGSANTDADRRLAMLWGDGDTVKDPSEATYNRKNQQSNGTVASQIGDGDSLYSYYKKLIMIRNANPEIARGTYTSLNLEGTNVGGFIAEYNGSKCMVIHNTTGKAETVDLAKIGAAEFTKLAAVIGVTDFENPVKTALDGATLVIDPQTSVVLR